MFPCFSDRCRIAPQQEVEEPTPMDPKKTVITGDHTFSIHPIDYDVYQSVGVGFFGTSSILIANHKPSGSFVVLRVTDMDTLSSDLLSAVVEEMKLSQLLRHPNIACYYGSFVVETKLWAVQPLMHYGSCADIMHSAKPFKNGFHENIIAAILRDVVSALDYLHNLGYVHGSVRAKHFLINKEGTIQLSGLRCVQPLLVHGTKMKATYGHFSATVDNICWLAPEVLAQDSAGYSSKSDIYSVGIAALELATGEAPFAGLPVTEIMMLKLRAHPPLLMRQDGQDELAPQQVHKSAMFHKVVDACVDPNPIRRPSSAKLLSLPYLRTRKMSAPVPTLNELLKPVVPLDTSKLTRVPLPDAILGIEQNIQDLHLNTAWS